MTCPACRRGVLRPETDGEGGVGLVCPNPRCGAIHPCHADPEPRPRPRPGRARRRPARVRHKAAVFDVDAVMAELSAAELATLDAWAAGLGLPTAAAFDLAGELMETVAVFRLADRLAQAGRSAPLATASAVVGVDPATVRRRLGRWRAAAGERLRMAA